MLCGLGIEVVRVGCRFSVIELCGRRGLVHGCLGGYRSGGQRSGLRGGIEGWRSRLRRRNNGRDGNNIRGLDCGHRRRRRIRSVDRRRLRQLVVWDRGARVP